MLRIRPHDPDELSHYSAGTRDVEFVYPWGWGELEGIANRTDFDLTQHAKFSGEDLTYFDQESERHYVPYVIEPAAGADRATLAFLLAAYHEEEVKGEKRTVLRLDRRLAPIKVAVLPLSRNEKLAPLAGDVAEHAAAALHDRLRRRRRRSAAATAARTKSARRCASPSTSTRSTTTQSPCATATRWNRRACRSTGLLDELRARLDCPPVIPKMTQTMDDDYYDLLGVDSDAPTDDIRSAYRDKKAALGDQGDKADAAALNKAWNVLSDPYQRGRYDEQRARPAATTTATTATATKPTARPAKAAVDAQADAPRAPAPFEPRPRALARRCRRRRSSCPRAPRSHRSGRASSRWSSTSSS